MTRRIRVNDLLTVDPSGNDFRDSNNSPHRDEDGLRAIMAAIKERRGWSTAQLAAVLDVDERAMRRWSGGEYTPSFETRKRMVEILASIATSSAENPVVLATLVAGIYPTLMPPPNGPGYVDTRVQDAIGKALEIADQIDARIAIHRNL